MFLGLSEVSLRRLNIFYQAAAEVFLLRAFEPIEKLIPLIIDMVNSIH